MSKLSRVAVGIRLALNLRVLHQCRCGSQVDSLASTVLSVSEQQAETVKKYHLNDGISKSLASAGVPVSKEPSGLSRSDSKRPDGLTLIPWRARAGLSYGM